MNKLPENLKLLRELKGVGQKELAIHLHCSVGTVSNYENGRHIPDPETLLLLADFYGVTVDFLLGRSTDFLPDDASDDYTAARLLRLLKRMSKKDKDFLAYILHILETALSLGPER